MRVLHVIPSISPSRGGPSQAVLEMAAALCKQNVDASILTTDDNGANSVASISIADWFDYEVSGVQIPVLAFRRLSSPLLAVREFTISPEFSRWLGKNARRYDLVHFHALFSFTTSLGMAQLRRQHVPYILRTIGQLNRWSLSQSRARKQLFLKLVDRANLQGARALHFTSEAERQEAGDLHLDTPSFVLPLGVPQLRLDRQAIPAADGPIRWLFLSRLHPKKQLPLLLDALAALKQSHPARPWQLDIAGDGDPEYLQHLKQHCNSLGLNPQVNWHGFVAGAAKQQLLQQADWFVLPSASENFGIAAAEALMAGTPVLLSPGVALAADVQKAQAGIIYEPTVEALAACLEHCLEPPSLSMRQAARQLAEQQFSWGSISRQLIGHYEAALRG